MRNKKLRVLRFIELFFLVILPSLFVLTGVLLIEYNTPKLPKQAALTPIDTRSLKGLNPSDILTDVLYYSDKEVNIHGIVVYGEGSCEKRSCPDYDSCCGCSSNRDLILKDTTSNLFNQSGEIKIFDPGKQSICQRKQDSCDYDCNDWVPGGLYEITGTLVVVRPLGLTVSRGYLEFYLEVKGKHKISGPTPVENKDNMLDTTIKRFLPIFAPKNL